MGTVGKTGVERILLGSVTHKVLQELPCSVLTMKEEDVVRLRLESAISAIEEHFMRGQQLLESGLLAEAVREFDQCLLSSPTYAAAWKGKALAYERLGEKDQAEAARAAAKRIRGAASGPRT
jgi:universal stress protein E